MAIKEPVPCGSCGMLPSQCSCLPQDTITFHVTTRDMNGVETAVPVGVSYNNTVTVGSASNSQTVGISFPSTGIGFPSSETPVIPSTTFDTGTTWQPQPCTVHSADPESIRLMNDAIEAVCALCGNTMIMPRPAGNFSFEKGGTLIGRAMTLEDDDEESVGDLLAELKILEEQVERDVKRYKRTLGLVQLARSIVKKKAIADNAPIE